MKRVLVVEDEEAIADIMRLVLEARGYRVCWAPNGNAAIQISAGIDAPIDLLFCDLLLPDKSAAEIIQAVRLLHPAVRVVITTGHTPEYVRELQLPGPFCVLHKPFDTTKAAECVTCVEEEQTCSDG